MKTFPEKGDKIIIVGAGAGGIDMARRLIHRGHKKDDIIIIEKTDKVGGKSIHVKTDDGIAHDLGTVFLNKDYILTKKLIEDYQVAILDELESGKDHKLIVEKKINKYSKFRYWNDKEVAKKKKQWWMLPSILNGFYMINALNKYIDLREKYFKTYKDFRFPLKMSDKVLEKIDMNFYDFLLTNKCEELIPLFTIIFNGQGYGSLQDLSTFYGLWWMTTSFIRGVRDEVLFGQNSILIFEPGFSSIWEIIAYTEKLNIHFDNKVKSITRTDKTVTVKTDKGQEFKGDFLIMDVPIDYGWKLFKNPSSLEKEVGRKIINYTFVTTLFKINNVDWFKESYSTIYWPINMEQKKNGMIVSRFTFPLIRKSYYVSEEKKKKLRKIELKQKRENKKKDNKDTLKNYMLSYQFDVNDTKSNKHYWKIIKAEITKQFNDNYIELIYQNKWKYFPHFSMKDIKKGIIWDVLENQGHNLTWHVGSSVCFESIEDVVSYNGLLMLKCKEKTKKIKHTDK